MPASPPDSPGSKEQLAPPASSPAGASHSTDSGAAPAAPPPPAAEPAALPPPAAEPAAPPPPADAPEPAEHAERAARPRFPIVGIGASAGGLEALEALVRRLSHDGMAYVVLQHLAPAHESILTEILARCTALQVVTARSGAVVEMNTLHIVPPGMELRIQGGVLQLTGSGERAPRHAIDTFFRSLAEDCGALAIGVVLSGSGTDGTLGLRAIKEAGGITFAQDPATATQPSMPQSALDTGSADFCLPPLEIGDELMRLGAHPYVARKRPPAFNQEQLKPLLEQLRRAFGVDFTAYRMNTICRRIERRMALQKVEKVEDYLELASANADELGILYSDLLIGVTGFFRDREPFEALKTVVFPRLLEQRSTDAPIRIWVPGCSTGEEVYSVAMCLLEYLDTRPAGHKVQIFGTDIDESALARARQAHYPQNIEIDVSPSRLQRFFSLQDKGYQVSRQIRDMVVFARHNLGKDPPFSRLDLICCRNVLIYMQPSLQRRVLRVFHYALNPDAFLMLGTSESVGDTSDLFSLLDRKLKIYIKKNITSVAVFDFSMSARQERAEPPHLQAPAERRPLVSMQQLADRKVLEKFGPPGVLVDERMEIVQFRGQTGPYLGPSPGAATLNVLKLVRPELLVELRTSLQAAAEEGIPVTSEAVRLPSENGKIVVTLDVMPLQEPGTTKKCFLVLFREVPLGPGAEARGDPRREGDAAREPRLLEIERELLVTKEYLQTTVQELEAANEELQSSNEELQSSNEELQSSNEELQSTNEELETSKEELQSTNEELVTVNEELQNRMAQLGVSNDDLQNVLASGSVAIVIVGMDLRIRRFSAEAERLLALIPADLGRPVAYLASALSTPQVEALVSDTINSVRERAQRVRCSDNNWYSMRVLPYRTADHAIRGALIELVRAPPARRPGEPVETHELIGKALSTLPHVLLLLDGQLRIVWANKPFFDVFHVGAEVIGQPLDEVWPARTTHPRAWNAIEQAAAGGPPFTGIRVAPLPGRTADRPARLSARHIYADGERQALTLVILEEELPEEEAPEGEAGR